MGVSHGSGFLKSLEPAANGNGLLSGFVSRISFFIAVSSLPCPFTPSLLPKVSHNRLKAEAAVLSRNKPSIKPEAAGRVFYARFISR